ncbi:hypothetical protein TNCV_1074911 [Trichonephila clavipes]|uniref:Uncharacterized protein n=1 Tax=Trichonephila clavipes TaxID=2585209 RepID=A0A8X6SQJ4_TRICX|nr:hypothetical protein TNCV_1074911 [Trichonephila clavipes]
MKLKGGYSPVPCTRDSAHKTFGPTDLTSTYSVCTFEGYLVTSYIGPRPSGLESDALTTSLPTTTVMCSNRMECCYWLWRRLIRTPTK